MAGLALNKGRLEMSKDTYIDEEIKRQIGGIAFDLNNSREAQDNYLRDHLREQEQRITALEVKAGDTTESEVFDYLDQYHGGSFKYIAYEAHYSVYKEFKMNQQDAWRYIRKWSEAKQKKWEKFA